MDVRLAFIGDELSDDFAEQLAGARRSGLLEVRTIGRQSLAALGDEAFSKALDQLAAEPTTEIVVVDTPIGSYDCDVTVDLSYDVAQLELFCVRALALGCRKLRVMSYPNTEPPLGDAEWRSRVIERLRSLVIVAQAHGVTLLAENCAGWAGLGSKNTLDLLDAVASPSLKLLFDTGNCLDYGYSGTEFLADVVHAVEHVHLKDASWVDGQIRYVPAGTGDCDVARMIEILISGGYSGVYSLEPHLSLTPHKSSERRADRALTMELAHEAAVGLLKAATDA